MPRKVELHLAIYLPKWLGQLDSLPLAMREKESRGKCLVWNWLFVFCWAKFSLGASNLWLCLQRGRRVKGDEE